MSGTSFDGVDAAVVDFSMQDGILTADLQWWGEYPFPEEGRHLVQALLPPHEIDLQQLVEADTYLGRLFADVSTKSLDAAGGADAICSHGQTVFHWVENGKALGTLQIGQPAWIAEATGLPVVADIRARDIAADGQGAPLVSFLDVLALADLIATEEAKTPAALNLGGIANVTVVNGSDVQAWDTGPANALIDAFVVSRALNDRGFDEDGRIAASGTVNPELLDVLLTHSYYEQPAPKSTGKEIFNIAYLEECLATLAGEEPVSDEDIVATLTELTARTVAADLEGSGVDHLVASGGGTHNPVLMDALKRHLPGVNVEGTDTLGIPGDAKEAILCALIGWCTMHSLPAVLPGVTGSHTARVLGSITPGNEPLRLPEPIGSVRALRWK